MLNYLGYSISFVDQHNGVLGVALHPNGDQFKIKFIGYTPKTMFKRMQKQCGYRLENNIIQSK